MSGRTIRRGTPLASGTEGSYYTLAYGPAEPRLRRLELAPAHLVGARPHPSPSAVRRSLLRFVHLTDVHTIDPESPGRLEFMERYYDASDPPWGGKAPAVHLLLPAHRPQEALTLHACETMLRTVRALPGSLETGAPVQFVLCTGDHTDNNQLNELHRFIRLMEGGTVALLSKAEQYEGVQSLDWDDPEYWHADEYPDRYKERWGFPSYPGLLDEAMRPFSGAGVGLPWLSCYGNHDALMIGTIATSPRYDEFVTGSRKPQAGALPPSVARSLCGRVPGGVLPPQGGLAPHPSRGSGLGGGLDALARLRKFLDDPEAFLTGPARDAAALLGGPTRAITPDPERRSYTRHEYIGAHLLATGEPAGHGFTAANCTTGAAYYVHDGYPYTRLIVLDTVNPCGHYEGSIGVGQYRWLEERLIEVHSCYYSPDGCSVHTGNEDRLVIICSHHGSTSLTNDLIVDDGARRQRMDLPRILGGELECLLHRFPNVVLWLNGHTHRNTIRPRQGSQASLDGFWEVTTCSLIDWPCQAREVEVVDNGDGTLSIFCTMLDHLAPPDPRDARGVTRLAAIHRELAANDPHAGTDAGNQGQLSDRAVELVIEAPSRLS